jgi:hypothetical protein
MKIVYSQIVTKSIYTICMEKYFERCESNYNMEEISWEPMCFQQNQKKKICDTFKV